jgi:type IV pilus assembly protein PilV
MNMNPSRGFSLVEVLVSIVVLSIALLGTAGLTAASLKSTNTSYYRSQATVLADDILDRMRANVVVARGGIYNVTGDPPVFTAGSGTALFDVTEWSDTVAQTLPGGVGNVEVVAGVATIDITWGGEDNPESFTTVSQL